MKASVDYILKILIIGDSGVGKTCVLMQYTENTFNNNYLSTIGIDYKPKTIEIDQQRVKLSIWDTAGQERYKTITQNYYKGASGIILAYSINDRETFENISNWMKQIEQHSDSRKTAKILIATKIDIDDRVVAKEEGQDLADQYGIHFFETSAKQKVFDKIAREGLKNAQQENNNVTLGLSTPGEKKKKSCC